MNLYGDPSFCNYQEPISVFYKFRIKNDGKEEIKDYEFQIYTAEDMEAVLKEAYRRAYDKYLKYENCDGFVHRVLQQKNMEGVTSEYL